jgi:hypothetical protein
MGQGPAIGWFLGCRGVADVVRNEPGGRTGLETGQKGI